MVLEYTARWAGGRIGSGATVMHFQGPADTITGNLIAAAMRQWFSARQAALPNDVTITFDAEIRNYALDGTLQTVIPITAPAPVTGSYADVWTNGAGRMVRYSTGQVVNGRRLNGRTFLVPSGGVFDNTGNVLGGTITADQTAHDTFRNALLAAGTEIVVWSRTYSVAHPVLTMSTVVRPVGLRTRND